MSTTTIAISSQNIAIYQPEFLFNPKEWIEYCGNFLLLKVFFPKKIICNGNRDPFVCCLYKRILLPAHQYFPLATRLSNRNIAEQPQSTFPHPSQPQSTPITATFLAQPSIIKSCISPLHLDRGKNRKFLPELFTEQYSA